MLVAKLNADPKVDGILVQLPLPKQINSDRVLAAVDPMKDVDGFHPVNAGRLATGLPALVPCTPVGCVMLAKLAHPSLAGLDSVCSVLQLVGSRSPASPAGATLR